MLGGAVIGDFEGSSDGIFDRGDVTRIDPDIETLVAGSMLGDLLEGAIVVIMERVLKHIWMSHASCARKSRITRSKSVLREHSEHSS